VLLTTRVCQAAVSTEERMAAESFYRDANTLLYADNNPTEDAIDRVVSKINREYVIMLLVFLPALTSP